MTPNDKLLKFLSKNDFITLNEAVKLGISKMSLSRMVKDGKLYRPIKRIYSTDLDWLTHPLHRYAPVCTLYPHAVVCGVSALMYYDLTDEEERNTWIAFPHHRRVMNREYRILYPSGDSYSLGITRYKCAKRQVRIYDIEKSVVDAFKYLPIDIALKALRAYLKRKDSDIGKLSKYAKQLRKPQVNEAVRTLLSDE